MKITKEKIYLFLTTMMVFLLPAGYVFLIQASEVKFDFSATNIFLTEKNMLFLLSYLLVLLIVLAVLALTGSFIITTFLSGITVTILAFANYQKMLARNASIYPEDLAMIKEAKLLMAMVDQKDLMKIIILALFLIALCIGLFILVKKKMNFNFNKKIIYSLRLVLLVFSCVGLFIFSNINEPNSIMNKVQNKLGIEFIDWSQPDNYRENGFVMAFLSQVQTPV